MVNIYAMTHVPLIIFIIFLEIIYAFQNALTIVNIMRNKIIMVMKAIFVILIHVQMVNFLLKKNILMILLYIDVQIIAMTMSLYLKKMKMKN